MFFSPRINIEAKQGNYLSNLKLNSAVITTIYAISAYQHWSYHQIYNKSNTMSATSGAGTAYTFVAPQFTSIFLMGFVELNLAKYDGLSLCNYLFFLVDVAWEVDNSSWFCVSAIF